MRGRGSRLGGYDIATQGGTVRWVRTADGLQAVRVDSRTVEVDAIGEAIEHAEARELEALARLKEALARLEDQIAALEKALQGEG